MASNVKRKCKVVLVRGLPGSGKSSYVEEQVLLSEVPTARVNKDKIREMCIFLNKGDKNRRNPRYEKTYQEIEIQTAKVLLNDYFDVIVDDTNLKEKHKQIWSQVAQDCYADFEEVSFLHVPIEECVKRDAARKESVGRAVIYGLAASAGLVESGNIKVELNQPYVVFDLDGTLADCSHRLHYIKNGNSDWDSFFSEMDKDTPREHIVSLLKDYTYAGSPCVIMTGRPETYRLMCTSWLAKYDITYHTLLMRKVNDKRPDNIVKQELIDNYLPEDKKLIKIWVDDRQKIIIQVRSNGIPVFDCGDGSDY